MNIIQEIIISYVQTNRKLDLQEIRSVINEPLDLIADEAIKLYHDQYFYFENDECLIREESVKGQRLAEWGKIITESDPDVFFDANENYGVFDSNKGYPLLKSSAEVFRILQLSGTIKNYHKFIVRSHGKEREICSPSWKLRERQRWILKHILSKYKLPDCVHGFAQGKSIVTNARCHIGANEVACVDIKDFFPSITIDRVYNIFLSLGYNEDVSQIMADLCTNEGILPQGAPTSPMLSNIAMSEFDEEMMRYAEKEKIVYTRYADDITISGNSRIEKHLETVEMLIEHQKFQLNKDKTHIMKGNHRKIITGLVVSDTVKIPKRYKRKFRQELYYCYKYGILQHLKNTKRGSAVNFEEYMYGKAYYIKMVEPEIGNQFLEELDAIFQNINCNISGRLIQ